MKDLKLKIKFEGKTIAEQEGNNISDFDDVIDGLREKFDGRRRRGQFG